MYLQWLIVKSRKFLIIFETVKKFKTVKKPSMSVYNENILFKQEKMSAPSANMICRRPPGCRASQALTVN